MEDFVTKYFRGQGKLYIGDSRDALVYVGDVGGVSLEASVDRGKTIENATGSSGIGASFVKSVEYGFSAELRSIHPDHLAIALQGVSTALAGGSVTDESHTANHDQMIVLDHTKASSVVVTHATGTPTYTEGTDYVLHADQGMIEILSTGSIVDGSTILIDYSYAAQHHVTTDPQNVTKYIAFAGVNTVENNKQVRVEIYRVKLDPTVFDLISEDTVEKSMSGVVELDASRPAGDQFFKWKIED